MYDVDIRDLTEIIENNRVLIQPAYSHIPYKLCMGPGTHDLWIDTVARKPTAKYIADLEWVLGLNVKYIPAGDNLKYPVWSIKLENKESIQKYIPRFDEDGQPYLNMN